VLDDRAKMARLTPEDLMRSLLKVSVPVEAGNKALKDGSLAKVISDTMERIKPEAAFFGVEGGKRTAYMFFDLKDSSQMPSIVEPIFLVLQANVEVVPVMNPQELKSGLDAWQKQT
jgi:hypothetical protein